MSTLLRSIARFVVWRGLWLATRLRLYGLMTMLYRHVIKEVRADGSLHRSSPPAKHVPTILVLSYEAFRGDIETLSSDPRLRTLVLPSRWVTRLMFQFYSMDLDLGAIDRYFDPKAGDPALGWKQSHRAFLRGFLSHLYKALQIDAVAVHHYRYAPDCDWGAVSDQLGYPLVLLNRENIYPTTSVQNILIDKLSMIGPFEGSSLVVHNTAARDLFVTHGFADADKVHVLGCPRMDPFLEDIERGAYQGDEGRIITFFGFAMGAQFERGDIEGMFVDVHRALLNIAEAHSDIRIVIKLKPNIIRTWHAQMREYFPDFDTTFAAQPNLAVDDRIPAHDLIRQSRVVVAFNSTTVLEAAIAGRNVIIPCYGPLMRERYENTIFFRDRLNLFKVPRDGQEFERMVMKELEEPVSSDTVDSGIKDLFEEHVSTLDCSATGKYLDLILGLINKKTSGLGQPMRSSSNLAAQAGTRSRETV